MRLGTAGGACRDMIRLGALGLGEARQAWQFWSGRVLSRRGEVWNGRRAGSRQGSSGLGTVGSGEVWQAWQGKSIHDLVRVGKVRQARQGE